jgi:small nuclear ribonucleoprotein (snRNP)-like protein
LFRRRHPGLNKQVLISLFSGNAVSGVLTATPGEFLILRGCTVLEPGSEPAAADGEMVI